MHFQSDGTIFYECFALFGLLEINILMSLIKIKLNSAHVKLDH